MAITASAATNGISVASSPAASAAADTTVTSERFLKLLVAQMRYQDPTKPTDNSQFLAQTAQFTTVEKMSEIAKSQADALAVQLRLSASNLVGRTITYPGPDGAELTGVVTSATFTGSSPTLKVGNTDVPLSSVREVRHNADPSAPSNP